MKYIIACFLSVGLASAGMAQGYSEENTSASAKEKPARSEYPSVDINKNDHLAPDQSAGKDMDDFFLLNAEVKPEPVDELVNGSLDDHLSFNETGEISSTAFGRSCSMKWQEGGAQANPEGAREFKMKGKNFKAERKASGEERVKFHDRNEYLTYHQKKNGKSHYRYLYKDKESLLLVEKKKNKEGVVVLKSENLENNIPGLLMKQGNLAVENDIHSCMR
jgi:hypothetical protein